MSRKHFQQGLTYYKAGNFKEALDQFNKAIENGGQTNYTMFDTRAAVFSKLGETKEALKDAKKTIEVAPDRWQGYARASRLFLQARKFDASLTMVRMGLSKLKEQDTTRRASLLSLEVEVVQAQQDAERRRQRFSDHMGNLPIEIFGEIARLVVQQDHTDVISLSQVSKHWRHVIHNSPYLWDVLILGRRRPTQKAKLWIERSKGRIRELSVQSRTLMDFLQFDETLLDLQWEHLRILKAQSWDVSAYLRSIGKLYALTNLQHLEIENDFGDMAFPPGDPSFLQHLAISRTILSLDTFESIVASVRTLKSLTLESVAVEGRRHFSELLEVNPMLETLSLSSLNIRFNSLDLSHLTSLELRNVIIEPTLLIDVPELRILRLEGRTPFVDSLMQCLVEKSSPDGLHLTEIVLRSCVFDSNSVLPLLQISPELQILEVSNVVQLATPIIETLAASYSARQAGHILRDPSVDSSANPILCPNLMHVNFSRCTDVQTGPLVRMVKSRLPPAGDSQDTATSGAEAKVKRLISLAIDECPNVDSTWLPWFRSNVQSVSCVYMKKKAKFRA
ncbi:hypothetical protein BDZ97DRAFT_561623 [Flammula alnicola]|nr:hypothetical protein BDZ97DRAFT_561623 [Flammula alnicola]